MNKNLYIPAAIILAGIFVAIAVYMTGNKTSVVNTAEQAATVDTNVTVRPVSATEHILGSMDAPIKIIDYSDTECPYCKNFHQTLKDIYTKYVSTGQVAWVYREFPIHSKSEKESEALECAADLGGNATFWKYLDEIFSVTPSNDGLDPVQLPVIAKDVGLDATAFNSCLGSGKEATKVQADYQDAINAGGGSLGTPYTVFVTPKGNIANTQGAIPYDAVNNYIQIILSNI